MCTLKKEKLKENGNLTKTENKEVPSLVSVISCHMISLNIRQK
jgi:hypothetical protein